MGATLIEMEICCGILKSLLKKEKKMFDCLPEAVRAMDV